MKKSGKFQNSMRAVTINSEFSLPGLIRYTQTSLAECLYGTPPLIKYTFYATVCLVVDPYSTRNSSCNICICCEIILDSWVKQCVWLIFPLTVHQVVIVHDVGGYRDSLASSPKSFQLFNACQNNGRACT